MTRPDAERRLQQTERFIAALLWLGVLTSMVLMVAGMGIMLLRHPDYLTDPAILSRLTTPGAAFPHSLRDVVHELGQGRGRAIMMMGLLTLILTPILRVVVSIVVFTRERDWRFVVITSLVLAVLLVSLLIGKAG